MTMIASRFPVLFTPTFVKALFPTGDPYFDNKDIRIRVKGGTGMIATDDVRDTLQILKMLGMRIK
jgi:hypothetical protein